MKHMHNFSFCPKTVLFMSQVSLQYPLIFFTLAFGFGPISREYHYLSCFCGKMPSKCSLGKKSFIFFTVPEDTIHHTRKMQQREQEASSPMFPHSAKWREMKASVQVSFHSVCDHSPESDATQLE